MYEVGPIYLQFPLKIPTLIPTLIPTSYLVKVGILQKRIPTFT